MKQTFIINEVLPSFNEYIRQTRASKYGGAQIKKSWQHIIITYIRAAHLKPMKSPVLLKYIYYAPNKRKDKDNISSIAHKFIQDALVVSGIIQNDTWDDIKNSLDEWHIDKADPRIVVEVEEVE